MRPFVVMDVVARAKELEAQGRDVVRLEIGDPDFPTPRLITEAAEKAMEAGETGYTQSAGLPTLREAIVEHMRTAYGVTVSADDIVVTQGTSPAMLLTFGALLDPGDEVVMPDPCYPAYPNYVRFLGSVPVSVRVRAEDGFRFRLDELEAAITPRTKAIVVNSPGNPTGAVLHDEDLRALADIAEWHGVWIVSDEIYHGLQFSDRSRSMLEYTDRVFVLNGFSKAYAMTGWRLGYLVAPREFVRAAEVIQQNFFLCANHFVQVAGAVALLHGQGEVARMRAVYAERRAFLVPALRALGLRVEVEPEGAFYVFADARAWGEDSLAIASRLLEEAGVAVAPGVDFGPGGEGFLRFSYATSTERLEEGVERLAQWVEKNVQ
ncbi:MAG: pyridoxal phosphate-dependent aminotransferase [Coriobacteriia bacterium]|nr:pyridoxal phosphate-dependent aminotransferase [Coriobacteriia bacterium]